MQAGFRAVWVNKWRVFAEIRVFGGRQLPSPLSFGELSN
jgi:hypothetical protein